MNVTTITSEEEKLKVNCDVIIIKVGPAYTDFRDCWKNNGIVILIVIMDIMIIIICIVIMGVKGIMVIMAKLDFYVCYEKYSSALIFTL